MTCEQFLNNRVVLHPGDCLDVLAQLEECSVDSCVTDPPYHLTSIVQRFGAEDAAPPRFKTGAYGGGFTEANGGTGAAFARMSRGFMGKVWDGGDIAFQPETWRVVYRVLKPGAHLIAMGGTRTYHRMACAIEDAGFEIRDTVSWLYGSGFPKSHDVSKGIDRAAGAEREVTGIRDPRGMYDGRERASSAINTNWREAEGREDTRDLSKQVLSAPATDAARQWEGWGTALKPACELIVLARKPLSEGTVAANVLRWGTGAINVDGCRVEGTSKHPGNYRDQSFGNVFLGPSRDRSDFDNTQGRWPANVVHDGSDEVTAAFPDSGPASSGGMGGADPGMWNGKRQIERGGHDDNGGSAARFFFQAKRSPIEQVSAARFHYGSKADADDRLGARHPTIKPLDLMQWLVRLVTPKSGVVLDPFAGTGTTGEAAWREGCNAVLIEAEPEYQADIRRRMALVLAGPDERARESMKAKNLPRDDGPLFSRETWAEMWAKPFDFSQEPKP